MSYCEKETRFTVCEAVRSANCHDTKPNATRLAHSCVTLSETKGLKYRFFAALRMTVLEGYSVKCTNVLHSGLVLDGVGEAVQLHVATKPL